MLVGGWSLNGEEDEVVADAVDDDADGEDGDDDNADAGDDGDVVLREWCW